MIVNTKWLSEYLAPAPSLKDLLDSLPNAGIEVESAHVLRQELDSVRVGFIRKKEPVPGTSGMFVCDIELNQNERRQIVCASEHPLEVGWGVPVALPGTELPTGISIKEEHFHGLLSQGMICLDGELGMLASGTGMQVFHDEALRGKPLAEVMELPEALLHLKILPNRPDCLGLIGIAREVAALLNLTLVLPPAPLPASSTAVSIPVEIVDKDLCPRYTCQVVHGVRVAKSRPWLHSRLLATGSRPINNVVDITNLVLQEWGHPLHAFDLSRIRNGIVVRRFRDGESLELLDGRKVTGEKAPLAIADSVSPMALAGIMGGRLCSISPDTQDVVLEAACFEATHIRRTSRGLAISTDSSYRFERGLDPNETLEAARQRAVSLLLSEAGGAAVGPVSDAYPVKVPRRIFPLSAARVSHNLGIPITPEQMQTSLERLGHRCLPESEEVEVPTRRVDVNDSVVLIEDVARMVGYDTVQPTPSAELPTPGTTTILDRARESARKFLTSAGFLEVRGIPLEAVTDSRAFVQRDGEPVRLTNPLIGDLTQLRRSLVPGLLATATQNARRHSNEFRYFEIDKTFRGSHGDFREDWGISLLLGGKLNDNDWSTRREADFFDLKGIVESLFESLQFGPASFQSAHLEGYAKGTAARITTQGLPVGILGQIAPDVLAGRRIEQQLFAAEIFTQNLLPDSARIAVFEQPQRFPAVFRDLSFVLRNEIPYAEIGRVIRDAGQPLLERVDCIDVFEGKGIPTGSRSITVSLIFRASDRTLVSEDAASSMENVIESLAKNFNASPRSN